VASGRLVQPPAHAHHGRWPLVVVRDALERLFGPLGEPDRRALRQQRRVALQTRPEQRVVRVQAQQPVQLAATPRGEKLVHLRKKNCKIACLLEETNKNLIMQKIVFCKIC